MRNFNSEKKFLKYLNFLIESKKDFKLTTTNAGRVAIWEPNENLGGTYRNRIEKEEQRKLWVYSSVKRECRLFLNGGKWDPLEEYYPPVRKNLDKIKSFQMGYDFCATDLKHCYWRVARIMEVISEKLYNKALSNDNYDENASYKLARNKALSCLSSARKIETYEKGELIDTDFKKDEDLSNLYSDIRNNSYKIMHGAVDICKSGFIMLRVDCIYYDSQYRESVEQYFRDQNVLFRTEQCTVMSKRRFVTGQDIKNFYRK